MTDRELMQKALEALGTVGADHICEASHHAKKDQHKLGEPCPIQQKWHIAYQALRERLAQPEPVIDKSAAIRIATALGWVPPGDTSQDCVDQAQKQRQEQEPVVKWDASAPLVITPHPAFQATQPQGIYYTPPQRTWVGLTDEEIRLIAWGDFGVDQEKHLAEVLPLARAIEAKLREKNT